MPYHTIPYHTISQHIYLLNCFSWKSFAYTYPCISVTVVALWKFSHDRQKLQIIYLPPRSKNWNQNQVANDTRLKSNGKNCFRAECKCLFVIVFVLVLIVLVRWPNQPLQMDSLNEYKYWVTQSLSTYTLTHIHLHTQ